MLLSQTVRRNAANWILAAALLLALTSAWRAQGAPEDFEALRAKAFQLVREGNQVAALPLLEKLAVMRPDDSAVLEKVGAVLVGARTQSSDPEERKKLTLRARGIFLKAQKLGNNSNYVQLMLEQLPENGEESKFSNQEEVDQAIREGEAEFAKGNFAAALENYKRAYQLDPTNYGAALFAGDTYQSMKQMDMAGEWFAKAVQIDPNRETAYRYWGNSLLRIGKSDEARVKYIQAIVAEPYKKASWTGLIQWGEITKTGLGHPQIESPVTFTVQGDKVNINVNPNSSAKGAGEDYWAPYPMARAVWVGEKFKKEFPDEKEYRHSLREESEALAAVAARVAMAAADPAKRALIPPDLQALMRLRDQALLEPFVLLSQADNGTAQDYAAYRAGHRDKLAQYISEWIISTDPAK